MSNNLTAFTKKNLTNLDKTMMTSIEIAKLTGKEHKHVLRDIEDETSKISDIITEPIFGLSDYIDSTGRKLPMYHLTKKGVLQLGARYDAKVRYKLISTIEELEVNMRQQAEQMCIGTEYPYIHLRDLSKWDYHNLRLRTFQFDDTVYFVGSEVIRCLGFMVLDIVIDKYKAWDYVKQFKVECAKGKSFEHTPCVSLEGVSFLINCLKPNKSAVTFESWFVHCFVGEGAKLIEQETPARSLMADKTEIQKLNVQFNNVFNMLYLLEKITKSPQFNSDPQYQKGIITAYDWFFKEFKSFKTNINNAAN